MKKEAIEVLMNRRAIRCYKNEQVSQEELTAVLEAGTYAPTSRGLQTPYIVAVQESEDLALVKKSIAEYAALGLEVQLTEMSLRNYEEEKNPQHAEYYGKMFEVFCQANEGEGNPLTSVAIWGLADCNNLPKSHYTWKLNGPYCGLFTITLRVKDSFRTIYTLMGGE